MPWLSLVSLPDSIQQHSRPESAWEGTEDQSTLRDAAMAMAPTQGGAACPLGSPGHWALLLATEERRKQAGTQAEDMALLRRGGQDMGPFPCIHPSIKAE